MSIELAVLGGSKGAFKILREILANLPRDYPHPIAVVLHRGKDTGLLAQLLAKDSVLPVTEAADKELFQPGHVYIAPADYHLLIETGVKHSFALSTDEPTLFARPSIDALFESAAWALRNRVIGVLLSGASRDGAYGLNKIRETGGLTAVQDPATAEDGIMPTAALALARHTILQPAEIGRFLADTRATSAKEIQ